MLNEKRILDVMTPNPFTINVGEAIHRAKRIMNLWRVRNLPVIAAGKVVGIVNESDIKASHNYRYRSDLTVSDIMQEDPLIMPADASVAEVIRTMFNFKIEAALVVNGHRKLEGIFTRQDALRLLLEPRPAELPEQVRLAA